MEFWQIVVLAVIQGVTEFLPVSSSGHLVIASALLGQDEAGWDVKEVNVCLHVGTLFSVFAVYWHRIWRLLGEDRRVIGCLIVATLPAVVVGLTIDRWFEEVLGNALLAGAMLCVTGGILLVGQRFSGGKRTYNEMSWQHSLLMGLSQAFAILPGISRSGTTISTGMVLGMEPKSAATFSFLMALPAIGGAGLLEVLKLADGEGSGTPLLWLATGMVVSFLVGLGALLWLIRMLERGRFQIFAWWCIPVGLAVVIWRLTIELAA